MRRATASLSREKLEAIASQLDVARSTALAPWSTASVVYDRGQRQWEATCGWHPELRAEPATERDSWNHAIPAGSMLSDRPPPSPRDSSPHRERARLALSNARHGDVLRGGLTPQAQGAAPLPPERYKILNVIGEGDCTDAHGGLARAAIVTIVDALGVSFQHHVRPNRALRWAELPLHQMADGPCTVFFSAKGCDTDTRIVLKAGARHSGIVRDRLEESVASYTELIGLNSLPYFEGQVRVVLRWNPLAKTDLDLHCVTGESHCFCRRPNPSEDLVHNADPQDPLREGQPEGHEPVQTTTRGGPETITLTPKAGEHYRFVVHDHSSVVHGWSLRRDLTASNATLTLHVAGEAPRTFAVPSFGPLRRAVWDAFTLEFDEDGDMTVREKRSAHARLTSSVALPDGGVLGPDRLY